MCSKKLDAARVKVESYLESIEESCKGLSGRVIAKQIEPAIVEILELFPGVEYDFTEGLDKRLQVILFEGCHPENARLV